MPLPSITSTSPIVVTPTEVTEFNESFMTSLTVNADPNTAWTAIAILRNFNYAANVLAPKSVREQTLYVPDLLALAEQSPFAAQILGGLVELVGLVAQQQSLITQLVPLTQALANAQQTLNNDNAVTATLQTALTNAQQSLAAANGEIETLQTTLATAQAATSQLQTNLEAAIEPEDIAAAQVALDQNTKDIANAQAALDQNTQIINQANATITSIETQLTQNSVNVAADTASLNTAQAAFDLVNEQLIAINTKLQITS